MSKKTHLSAIAPSCTKLEQKPTVQCPLLSRVWQYPSRGRFTRKTAVALRFEVVSVKPNNADLSSSGIKTGHGRLDAKNVTLKRCIMGAYGVGPHQVSGGLDWLGSDCFEISAKADKPIDDDAVLMVMLQDLMAERFKLVLHRETRTIRALVLEVAKSGPKLEKAEASEAGTNISSSNTGLSVDAHNTDMDLFAKVLAWEMDLPVVNVLCLAPSTRATVSSAPA
jgi:uncharacterized protein (TIGR03435 family)